MRRSSTAPTLEPDNPHSAVYLAARREWNERYGSYIAQAHAWRLTAFASLGVALVAVAGVVWIGAQNRIVPYVVQTDRLGDAIAISRANVATPTDPRLIRAQLARWVADVRSVYIDVAAEKQVITEAYAMVDRNAAGAQALNDWFSKNDPFKRAQDNTVAVAVESVLPLSATTWRVEWREDTRTRQGGLELVAALAGDDHDQRQPAVGRRHDPGQSDRAVCRIVRLVPTAMNSGGKPMRQTLSAAILAALPMLAHAQAPQVPAIVQANGTAAAVAPSDRAGQPAVAVTATSAAAISAQPLPPPAGPVPSTMPPPIRLLSPSAPLNPKEQRAVAMARRWANRPDMPQPGEDGVIRFLYGATLPTVVCAPLQVCDLALQPGEIVNNVNIGDKVRWNVSPGMSGSAAGQITHLIIKPTDAGLMSSMTVETNRRTYAVKLVSTQTEWMPLVAFTYPDEAQREWSAYQQRASWGAAASTLPTGENVANLDFGFRLSGDRTGLASAARLHRRREDLHPVPPRHGVRGGAGPRRPGQRRRLVLVAIGTDGQLSHRRRPLRRRPRA